MSKKIFIKSNERMTSSHGNKHNSHQKPSWFKKNKFKIKIAVVVFVTFFATIAVSLWVFLGHPPNFSYRFAHNFYVFIKVSASKK